MRTSSGKNSGNDIFLQTEQARTQETIGVGFTANQNIISEDESLAQTVDARVEQELIEGAAQVQPFKSVDESPASSSSKTNDRTKKQRK